MRKGGIIMMIIDRGERLPWTYNWAPVLGFFIFFAGVALWRAGLKKEKNNKKEITNNYK